MLIRFTYDKSILDKCLTIGLPLEWENTDIHISVNGVIQYDNVVTTRCLFTFVDEQKQGYVVIDFNKLLEKEDLIYLRAHNDVSIIVELCATGSYNDIIVFYIDFRNEKDQLKGE